MKNCYCESNFKELLNLRIFSKIFFYFFKFSQSLLENIYKVN